MDDYASKLIQRLALLDQMRMSFRYLNQPDVREPWAAEMSLADFLKGQCSLNLPPFRKWEQALSRIKCGTYDFPGENNLLRVLIAATSDILRSEVEIEAGMHYVRYQFQEEREAVIAACAALLKAGDEADYYAGRVIALVREIGEAIQEDMFATFT